MLHLIILSVYIVSVVNCEKVIKSNNDNDNHNLDTSSSIRTYSSAFAPPDFSRYGNPNFEKTITFLKSLEDQPISSNPLLNQHFVGKSIVQFWPSDMNKKKFFDSMLGPAWTEDVNFRKEPSIFTDTGFQTTDLPPIAALPEKLPDIPAQILDDYEIYEKSVQVPQKKARKPIKDHKIELMKVKQQPITIENYENYDHPRQTIIVTTENYYANEDYAITNPGPVRFLSSEHEPETIEAGAHQDYNFPAPSSVPTRGVVGNKKRKLKKKVKTQNLAHFVETTAAYTPHTEQFTVSEISPENVHVQIVDGNGFDTSSQETPFQPVRFANVIDSVSNLTELSFRKNNVGDESKSDERTSYGYAVVEENNYDYDTKKTKTEPVDLSSRGVDVVDKTKTSTRDKYRGMTVNDLKPWDFMYVQLSRAIEDRDLVKIKSLVNAIGEKEKSRKLKKVVRGRVTTTTSPIEELPPTTSFKSRLTTTSVAPDTTVEVTEPITIETTSRRRYIAPRVRLSVYKALKESQETSTSDPASIENEELITTETQAFTTKPSTLAMTLKLFSTSEPTTEQTTVTESVSSTEKYAHRLRVTTERVRDLITTASSSDATSKTTRHHRRGRIATPRNRKLKVEPTTTLATTTNSSSIRPIRNSSRVRRIKGFRRMAGLSRY